MNWTVFGGARPVVHLNVVESLHNIKTIPMFNAVKWDGPWQGMLGSAAQPSTCKFLNWLHNIQTKKFFNTVKRTGPCLGVARPRLKLEGFWKTSRHPDEKLTQHRELSWTVFGGARPAVFFNVVECLHNIKTKKCLTPWNELGRDRGCWGARLSHQLECFRNGCITSRRKSFSTSWKKLGRVSVSTTQPNLWRFCKASRHPDEKLTQHCKMSWTVFVRARPAVHLKVVESLHNIKTVPVFNAVKWAAPWQRILRSAAQPSIWMFLKWLHNMQTKKFCNTVNRIWKCLGEHDPAKTSNVFEMLHAIRTKSWLNAVYWAGPWLGEHDQPFIWTLLKTCITSKRKEFSTPRNELGCDRGCWGVRPSHQLECFRNGCITTRRKGFSTSWMELGRVWGSTAQPTVCMFLKSFISSEQKIALTPWYKLNRIWGSTTSRSFERCW